MTATRTSECPRLRRVGLRAGTKHFIVVDGRLSAPGGPRGHVLRGCFHDPSWLESVSVQEGDTGQPVVVVTLHSRTALIDRCIPTKVENIEVRTVVELGSRPPS